MDNQDKERRPPMGCLLALASELLVVLLLSLLFPESGIVRMISIIVVFRVLILSLMLLIELVE